MRNVRFGISNDGDDVLIARNLIDHFSADGIRGLGDGSTYEYNVVKNCLVGDDLGDANHDDGFQSWSYAGSPGQGAVLNVVLRGNLIIDSDTPHPLRATMQGIGCFDGFFDHWTVENNVVITNHWHGISFYGMRHSRILNNTVIDSTAGSPGPAWLMVTDHKTRGPSDDVLVRNNLAQGGVNVSGTAIVADHNLTVTNLTTMFVDAANRNLRPKAGSPALDTGLATGAPTVDIDGVARPQGAAIDLGAYEGEVGTGTGTGTTGTGTTGGSGTTGGTGGGTSSSGGGGGCGSGSGAAMAIGAGVALAFGLRRPRA